MAVIYSLSKGYDPWYPWSGQGGGYYDVKGEPRGRWWGSEAPELGLEPGGTVDREAYRRVIAERVDPRDGETRLGRSPQKATARADARYEELLAAEPHATQGRRFELRQQAARDTRQGPLGVPVDPHREESLRSMRIEARMACPARLTSRRHLP